MVKKMMVVVPPPVVDHVPATDAIKSVPNGHAAPSNRRTTRSSISSKPASVTPIPVPPVEPAPEKVLKPSLKALGKRPERPSVPVPEADASRGVGKGEKKKDEKTERRVMPVRIRRGGPGVGSSAIDAMILESKARSDENRFIIPPDTVILITTDSGMVPPMPTEGRKHKSHFDKPEVISAYKKQQMIQTPEFHLLREDTAVGSRLRARGGSIEVADTSDAVYIRRHKKYETFEKRQRFREKEKLQYEHFKLRERIEELKAMDASAFASSIEGLDGDDTKRVMLQEAEELDRRYAMLLPGPSEKKIKKGIEVEEGSAEGSSDAGLGRNGSIRLRLKRGRSSLVAAEYLQPQESEEAELFVEDPQRAIDVKGEDGAAMAVEEAEQIAESDTEMTSAAPLRSRRHSSPARKRIRLVNRRPASPVHTHQPHPPSDALPVLLSYALASKSFAQPNAKRKLAPRHPLAFGVNMPTSMDVSTEFELPRWIVGDVERMRDGSEDERSEGEEGEEEM